MSSCRSSTSPASRAGRGGPGAGRPRQPHVSPPEPIVRRTAAAGCDRARARDRSPTGARRRAHGQPRFTHGHRDHGAVRDRPSAGHHHRSGDARARDRSLCVATRGHQGWQRVLGRGGAGARLRNRWKAAMKLDEMLRASLRALLRNKMRTLLTSLGMTIGVGAVIAMVVIGEGAKAKVEQTFTSMGTNIIIVNPGSAISGGSKAGAGTTSTLTFD